MSERDGAGLPPRDNVDEAIDVIEPRLKKIRAGRSDREVAARIAIALDKEGLLVRAVSDECLRAALAGEPGE